MRGIRLQIWFCSFQRGMQVCPNRHASVETSPYYTRHSAVKCVRFSTNVTLGHREAARTEEKG